MKNQIIYFKDKFYESALSLITKILIKNSTVLISGGNSIKTIIRNSKKKNIFINKLRTIILSDERIYKKINDIRTNYSNFKKNFFKIYKFFKINFVYFNLSKRNEVLAKNFLKKIKNKIPKVAILSLGNDGHICSIFKNVEKVDLNQYIEITKPKNKIKRITLNINFLKKIKKIYLIVNGHKKGTVLKKIILKKKTKFPLINFNNLTFIVDKAAFQKIKLIKNINLYKS